MDDEGKKQFREMVDAHHGRDDPTGWFDSVYSNAGGDLSAVHWADLAPSPHLISWMADHPAREPDRRATTIGCGLGDDAEAMAAHGYQVTAFDIAPTAIRMCRDRYPDSPVDYLVADLFEHPPEWTASFDLVFECNTIQALPVPYRLQALNAIACMVAPGGVVLVSCRSRKAGERENEFPLALDRHEIDGFARAGLVQQDLVEYDDDQDPPVPHFFACFRRPVEAP
ncbi:MAG: class I SAM-dependent methyltransferase [Acidobacteria bacterium]|uniref:Class I SAM-dependent methyltransferase n=1 Tax=Candidatus Polarisedimenticola svalbardensis TaxID=2886004 RepID=A0A8J6Y0G2_9BACT|nr:class I SAM-dependent methyltransferase [Candidatus Polarisedimenticola svalbardensis]